MDHFHVTLEGFPEGGDVITNEGEVIGTYTCDGNDYCEFKPDGSDEVIIKGYFVGLFCQEIAAWHEEQDTN